MSKEAYLQGLITRLRQWRKIHLTQLAPLLEEAANELEQLTNSSDMQNRTSLDHETFKNQFTKLPIPHSWDQGCSLPPTENCIEKAAQIATEMLTRHKLYPETANYSQDPGIILEYKKKTYKLTILIDNELDASVVLTNKNHIIATTEYNQTDTMNNIHLTFYHG